MGAAILPTAGCLAESTGIRLATVAVWALRLCARLSERSRCQRVQCTTGFFSESLNLTKLADGDEAAMDDLKSQLEAVGDNYIIEIDLGICKAYFVNDQPAQSSAMIANSRIEVGHPLCSRGE